MLLTLNALSSSHVPWPVVWSPWLGPVSSDGVCLDCRVQSKSSFEDCCQPHKLASNVHAMPWKEKSWNGNKRKLKKLTRVLSKNVLILYIKRKTRKHTMEGVLEGRGWNAYLTNPTILNKGYTMCTCGYVFYFECNGKILFLVCDPFVW